MRAEYGDSSLPDRFWDKVSVEFDDRGCWLWTAAINNAGYAMFKLGNDTSAHRIAYKALVGEIPKGLTLDHLCSNRSCVNPAHLEPVNQRENLMRGKTANAKNAAKTKCKRGHDFTVENTYFAPDGTRNCRACKTLSKYGMLPNVDFLA